mmetsp:Transcript_339/g.284  ORF Transcript_339/g.284 Transcript_339/m.284 type:complete len:111 (-) Transcript_339:2-334(-)
MFKQRFNKICEPTCPNVRCPLQPYSLIFMDINMPVMDGLESAKRILEFQQGKKTEEIPTCKIVFLTAFMNSDNIHKVNSLGIKDMLNKPANSLEIQNLILKYCPKIIKKK